MRIEEMLITDNQVTFEIFSKDRGYLLCIGGKDRHFPSIEKVHEAFLKQSSFDTIKLIHSGKKSYVHLFMDEVEVFDTKKALRRRLSLDSQGIWAEKRNGEKSRFFVEERGWFSTNYRQVSKDECRQKLERSSTMTKVLGVGLGILTLLPGAVEFARFLPIAPKEAAALGLIALNQRSPLLAAAGCSILPTQTKAQAVGLEFQVNTYTTYDQENPSVAPLNDGGFVITWESGPEFTSSWFNSTSGQDGDGWGIYGQRYNSSGASAGSEFQINTNTTNDQRYPSVAPLNDGGFVVTWESNGQDGDSYGIYGQRFSSNGTPAGSEFQINTYTTDSQNSPSVAPLNDGGFVITWTSHHQDGNLYGLYGQMFNNSGAPAGSEFQVNTYWANYQDSPCVASLNDGGFVVAWQSFFQDGDRYGIYGQRYDANGAPAGSEFQINTYTTDHQQHPNIASLKDGGFVVTWESFVQDGSTWGIYGQRYDSSGAPAGSEFQINTFTTSDQRYPSVAPLNNGGFVVTWTSYEQDGDIHGIYGQRYDSTGAPAGFEFLVNTYTTSKQDSPSVAPLNDGGFVVAWQSLYQDGKLEGIFGQRYDANGNPIALQLPIPSNTPTPTLRSVTPSNTPTSTPTNTGNLLLSSSYTPSNEPSSTALSQNRPTSTFMGNTLVLSSSIDPSPPTSSNASVPSTSLANTQANSPTPTQSSITSSSPIDSSLPPTPTRPIFTNSSPQASSFSPSSIAPSSAAISARISTQPSPTTVVTVENMVYGESYPILLNGETVGTYTISGGTGLLDSNNANVIIFNFDPSFQPEEEEIFTLFTIPDEMVGQWESIVIDGESFECLEPQGYVTTNQGRSSYQMTFEEASCLNLSPKLATASLRLALH